MKFFISAACVALALSLAPLARAVSISLEASDNATVQPAGPRTGTSGKAFFNIEGSANNAFASFGVADFDFAALPPLPGAISSVKLHMVDSPAGFSNTGPLRIFLTTQTGVSIQPTNTMLNYVGGQNGAASVDSDLAPLELLGKGEYSEGLAGEVDTFGLIFSGSVLTALNNAIATDGILRLVITPDVADTAATYAGATNTTFAGPTLVFEVVPEPGSGLLGMLVVTAMTGMRGRTRR